MYNLVATSCQNVPILGDLITLCAKLIGFVMELIFRVFGTMGIENVGLCIIILTLIVKLAMLPLTIKQQKFSKVSALMNPELQAIQKKYQNSRTQEDMLKMQEETKAVYEKYGTSPTGSCLQLLIQMPILFALYAVIWNIPGYVTSIGDMYKPVTQIVQENNTYMNVVKEACENEWIAIEDLDLNNIVKFSGKKEDEITTELSKLDNKEWENLKKSMTESESIENELKALQSSDGNSDDKWKQLKEELEDDDKVEEIQKAVEEGRLTDLVNPDNKNIQTIEKNKEKLDRVNGFFGLNLSQSPGSMMGLALLIPILSGLLQFASVKLTMSVQNSTMEENPMGASMRVMNYTMPVMSAFFCLTLPAGLGLYWVANSFFMIIQQIFINHIFKNMDVNDIIQKNMEKVNKKREKMGLPPNKVATAANLNTKNIENKTVLNKNVGSKKIETKNYESKKEDTVKVQEKNKEPGKKMSISDRANLVKTLNEKNKK